MSLQMFIAAI